MLLSDMKCESSTWRILARAFGCSQIRFWGDSFAHAEPSVKSAEIFFFKCLQFEHTLNVKKLVMIRYQTIIMRVSRNDLNSPNRKKFWIFGTIIRWTIIEIFFAKNVWSVITWKLVVSAFSYLNSSMWRTSCDAK